MSCEELRELYELYALGVLDPAERRSLEEHLAEGCPNCTSGIRQAHQLTAMLACSAPAVEPAKGLRARVVSSVSPAPLQAASWNWWTHAWGTLAILMLIAVIWYSYKEREIRAEIISLSLRLSQARTVQDELAARNKVLMEALALINLPDSRQLVFGATGREPPRGRIWVHPQRGVVLLASRLPAAPPGKTYEMWIVPKDAPPVPAGLFNSNERGEATHVWSQPVDPRSAAVAVTLEPEQGVPAPTSTPVIAVRVG